MNLTHEDYARAVTGVTRDLLALGSDLAGAYLDGSVARGEARPGKSDIDVGVFLRGSALEDRESYFRALSVLENAARGLMGAGLHYDGGLLYADDETRYVPLPWRPEFLSDRDSRLLAGRHIAADFDPPVPMLRGLRDVISIVVSACAAHLAKEELTQDERSWVLGWLEVMRKGGIQMACAAVGQPAVKRDAVRILAEHFPGLDLSALREIEELRGIDRPSLDLKGLLKRTLVVIEDLHRGIMRQQATGTK